MATDRPLPTEAIPPVRMPRPVQRPQHSPQPVRQSQQSEVLYILDDDDSRGIQLGPLKEVVAAEAVAESAVATAASRPEPIARAVYSCWAGLIGWWHHAKFNLPVKILLLAGIVFLLILNSHWLIPAGILLGVIYLIYFGVRSLMLAFGKTNSATATSPVGPTSFAQAAHAPQTVARRRKWQESARECLRKKTGSERLGELSGSLLMAAIVSVVLSLVMMMVGNVPVNGSVFSWIIFSWLAITSTAGAWGVLATGKLWESSNGEAIRRRFVMLVGGLMLGAVTFGASEFLDVQNAMAAQSPPHSEIWASVQQPGGSAELPIFMVYFAVLFVFMRWWLQTDPLRTTRLSLWSTGTCVLAAWVLSVFLQFPQPWGFLLPAAISIAVQLSAPWLTPKQRSEFRRQMPLEA